MGQQSKILKVRTSDLISTVHVDQWTDVGTPATTKRVEKCDVIEGVLVSEDYGLPETGYSRSWFAWCVKNQRTTGSSQISELKVIFKNIYLGVSGSHV